MKSFIGWLLMGIGVIFSAAVLFVAISMVFMLFPVNAEPDQETSSIRYAPSSYIAITYGLAHTNFLIDLERSSVSWDQLLPDIVPVKKGFLLVGWGDRDTYQSTPTWSDLQLSVALKALFLNTESALHLRYLPTSITLLDPVIPLKIDRSSAEAIESNILKSFKNNPPVVLSAGYDESDRFYYSKGKYNLLTTCNTWTGAILKHSGVEVSGWTPFSYNVVHSLRLSPDH